MTCALPDGVTLRFLRSGISVTPYETNLRAKKRNYMHGQVVISREDGRRIQKFSKEAEPAVLEFGGNVSQRFFVDQDATEFYFDYDDQERARIDLKDGRKVLERGSVNASYSQVSLTDVVEDIIDENRDDPNSVIENVRFTGADVRERILVTAEDLFSFLPALLKYSNPVGNWLKEQFRNLDDNPAKIYGGFEFDNISPLEAMVRVMDQFSYRWWVDPDGTLWIGQDGTFGNVVGTIADGNEIVMRRYDVVESSSKTNRVLATSEIPDTQKSDDLGPTVPRDVKTRLKSVAIASAPSIDGELKRLSSRTTISQGQLRDSATRYLYEEIMDDTNGSISINGLASKDKESLARLQPGDHFIVNEDIEEHCKPGTVTGHFLVKSVSHSVTPRQGWKIAVNVSKTLSHDKINTQSFYYDPTTDTKYDTLEAVQNNTETDDATDFGVP